MPVATRPPANTEMPPQPAPTQPAPQPANPQGRRLRREGTIYNFPAGMSDPSIERWFDKEFAHERTLAPEQAGGRSQWIDSEEHTELRQSTVLGQQGLEEYADLFSGTDIKGNPVVWKPEDITPQAMEAEIAVRKEQAAEWEKDPIDPLALKEFRDDTTAMERDLDRKWANETTLERFSRRLDKMTPEELIEEGRTEARRRGIKGKITAEKARQMLMMIRAAARFPGELVADEVTLNARPGYRVRKNQPREAFWAENMLREHQQKYGDEIPRNKSTLFDWANETYEPWLKEHPDGAEEGFDTWRRSEPIRGLLHPKEQHPPKEKRYRESLSEAMVMKHSTAGAPGQWVPSALKRIPFAGAAVTATELLQLRAAVKNVDAGKATDDDWFTIASAVDAAEKSKDRSFGMKVWDLVSHLPAFGTEFAMTAGAFSLGKAAATRVGGRFAMRGAATKLAGVATGIGAQTAVNVPLVASKVAEKWTPEYGLTQDEAGQLTLAITGDDPSFLKALGKGFGAAYIEMGSERAGVAVGRLGGLLAKSKAGRALAKMPVPQRIMALKGAVLGRFLARGGTTAQADDILRKAGWHGMIGEVFEERVADLAGGVRGIIEEDYGTLGKLLTMDPEGWEQLAVEAVAFAAIPAGQTALMAADKLTGIADRVDAGGHPSRQEAKELGMPPETARSAPSRREWFMQNRERLKKEVQDAEAVLGPEAEVRKKPSGEDLRRPGEKQVPAEPAGEVAPPRAEVPAPKPPVTPAAATEAPGVPKPVSPVEGPPAGPQEPETLDTTGTKNVKTDELREKAGLGERVRGEKESIEQWEAEALRRHEADPTYRVRLAEEVAKSGRETHAVEQRALGQYLRDLENRRLTGEDVYDDMLVAIEASEVSGTDLARAFRARQETLAPDFSVVGLVRQHRDAVGEMPNREQVAKIEKLADRITKLESEQDELQQKLAEAEVATRIAETATAKPPPRPKKGAKRERLQRQASESASAFKTEWATLFEMGAVHDPKREAEKWARITKAAGKVVKAYAELGVNTFLDFMARVRRDIGDITAEQTEAFTVAWEEATIASPLGESPTSADVGALARKLTQWAVEVGVDGREDVIDAVHEELQRIGLEISRSQTMQAMSGYGDFRELSEDEVSVKVRGYRGEIQQLLKLEDMQAGQAPAKSGVEQRTPTEEERRLTKLVNEAKKRGGYVVTDPARQLKSALNTAKTTIRNRITDLEKEIATREKIVKERTPLEPDAELLTLRVKRDALLEEHKKIFPPKKSPFSDAHRLKLAEALLGRQITELEADLAAGRLGPQDKRAPLTSPELDAKQQRLAELREERERAREASPEYQAQEAARQTARYKRSLEGQLAFWEQRRDEAARGKLPKKRKPTPIDDEILEKKLEIEGVHRQALAEIEKNRRSNLNLGQRIYEGLNEVTSLLPRTLMAGLEVSVVLRQGVFYTPSHPVRAFANIVQSIQAVFSEHMAFAQAENLTERANARNGDYSTGKVQFTQESGPLSVLEEMYQSAIIRWLAQTEGVLWLPARWYTKAYMMTERGFRTFANTMKADLFDILKADTVGIREFFGKHNPWTKADAKEIGRSANIFSGRGTGLKGSRGFASWFFFARRWAWSRIQAEFIVPFQMVTPKFIGQWNADPAMRVAHAKLYAQALVGVATYMAARYWLYYLLADDDDDKPTIEWDPRSSDFLKQKTGEARIDTLGGMQQPFVLVSRVLTGTTKTGKGEIKSLYGEEVEWGRGDAADAIIQYGRGKLGAGPSGILDWFAGKNLIGQTKTKADVITDRLTPMAYNDIWEAEKELSIPQGTVAAIEAFFGASVSTYGPRTTYRDAKPEDRKELFERFLDNMQWDSAPPAYQELLTAQQMKRVDERREEKKRGVIHSATDEKPIRAKKKSDKVYEQELKQWEKAQERFHEMAKGVSHDKAQRLLLDDYARKAGRRDKDVAIEQALKRTERARKRAETAKKEGKKAPPIPSIPTITGKETRVSPKTGKPIGHRDKRTDEWVSTYQPRAEALAELYGKNFLEWNQTRQDALKKKLSKQKGATD